MFDFLQLPYTEAYATRTRLDASCMLLICCEQLSWMRTRDPLWLYLGFRVNNSIIYSIMLMPGQVGSADVHDRVQARASDVVMLSCMTVTSSVTAQLTHHA